MQPSETKVFKDISKVGTFVPNDVLHTFMPEHVPFRHAPEHVPQKRLHEPSFNIFGRSLQILDSHLNENM